MSDLTDNYHGNTSAERIWYTLGQGWEILRHYFENHGNVLEYVRKLRADFGRRETPSAPYVHYLVKKSE